MHSIETLIRRHFAAACALDEEAWVATFAPDAVRVDPDQPPAAGHHQLRRFFQGLAAAYERVDIRPGEVLVTGRRVLVRWSGRAGRHDGGEVELEGTDVFEVDTDGLIAALWAYRDADAVAHGT